MRVLITGHTGLLGRALVQAFSAECSVIGVSRQAEAPHIACDVCDEVAVGRVIRDTAPDVVIHAAAMKSPDVCETQVEQAHRVNALGTRNVAAACCRANALMVYISTDYVFDGTNPEAYREDDRTRPVNVYGLTKRSGERYVEQLLSRFLIVRMCVLYGPGGPHFVQELIDRPTGGSAYAFDDQIGSVSLTTDVAEGIRALVGCATRKEASARPPDATRVPCGVYHIVNEGSCSRLEFARAVLDAAGRRDARIQIKHLRDDSRRARRPLRTELSVEHFEQVTGRRMRSWKEALKVYVASTRRKDR